MNKEQVMKEILNLKAHHLNMHIKFVEDRIQEAQHKGINVEELIKHKKVLEAILHDDVMRVTDTGFPEIGQTVDIDNLKGQLYSYL
jgi:hypothetical protein